MRLKLQMPLNISEALLDAARQQLQDELGVAKQVYATVLLPGAA